MRVQPSFLRLMNERRVLNTIRVGQSISRADIQRKLNMAMPTVSKIVDELINQSWVRSTGVGEISLGRPPLMLEINSDSAVAIGLDLSRTYIRTVCVNLLADVLFVEEIPLGDIHTGEEILNYLGNVFSNFKLDPSSVIGVGIAASGARNPFPGSPQRSHGIELSAHHHWHNEGLDELISSHFHIPVWVENDANAAVLGDMWFGSSQEAGHSVFIFVDEGLGAGIAVNGSIYTGSHNVAGEFSHMVVDLSGDITCECGRNGCIGSLAHVRGIRSLLEQNGILPNIPIEHSFNRAMLKIEPEFSLISKSFMYLATGIFNLMQVIDPNRVILGGSLFTIHPWAFEEVQRLILEMSCPKPVEIVPSQFGVNAVAIGAATLVLQHMYDHTKLVEFSEITTEPALTIG